MPDTQQLLIDGYYSRILSVEDLIAHNYANVEMGLISGLVWINRTCYVFVVCA